MTALLNSLREILEADGFKLAEVKEPAGLITTIVASERSWPLVAMADDEERVLLCYSVLPGRIAPEGRVAAAEALTRLNYDLLTGTFELDLDDGEVRVRTSLALGDSEPGPGLLRALVGRNVALAERHFPELEKLAQPPA